MSARRKPVRPAGSPSRSIVAIVVAGGAGSRLASRTPKPYVRLGAYPLLVHALRVLERVAAIDRIILVAEKSQIARARRAVQRYGITKTTDVVAGGATRTESVRHGLAACGPQTGWVVIHDAARPFITVAQVNDCLNVALKTGAAVCAIPCASTIKSVGADRRVTATLNRQELWEIQTPQIFRVELLRQAYARLARGAAAWYDDASLVEQLPYPVSVVAASSRNIKITTREDLVLARLLITRLRRKPRQ